MTKEELTNIRKSLGLGPVDMSRALGVSYTTYRDWQSGKTRVHPAAARCAEILAALSDHDGVAVGVNADQRVNSSHRGG